ncbi:MAG TPA: DUF4129 domain-containing protein [Pyrinomonadaceae bacterium]|nr:DUF4129 domain-containing protein [Pyrinomonadaceae bacterium]
MLILSFPYENFSDCCASLRLRKGRLFVARITSKRVALLSSALLLIFVGAQSALAMPLTEYKTRIHQSVTALNELHDLSETNNSAEYISIRTRYALYRVTKLVPSEETIEWEEGRVKVNNSWLSEELNNYERLSAGDAQRGEILARITQRLTALEDRLNELGGQNESAEPTKEQDKARLASILRRDEYVEKPPEKSLWERFKDWLNRIFPSRNPLSPGQSSLLSTLAMILIFGLAAGVLAYVIWKFAPYFLRWKGTQLKLEKQQARIVLGERLAPDQTGADLLTEAEALARKGEIRAAIRKGYIALLCELGDRKVISLAQHKTNHDYLRAVREKRPLLKEMQKLTASFENHWYGFVPADAQDWTTFRSGYQQTLKTATLLSDE